MTEAATPPRGGAGRERLHLGQDLWRDGLSRRPSPCDPPHRAGRGALCRALGRPPEESPVADRQSLERFHTPADLDAILAAEARGQASDEERSRFNLGTIENPVFPGLWARAATSVGGSVHAAEIAHAQGMAYHPAGGTHHGMADRAHGFCHFNTPVLAILRLIDLGRARVAHVDPDAHHGDVWRRPFATTPVC